MNNLDISFNDEVNFLDNDDKDWIPWITNLLLSAKKEINKENAQEMSINFVSSEKIHEINKKYRGKDRSTDVISFAIEDGLDEDFMSAFNDDPDFVEDIGDLFLCPEVIKRHSVEYETGFNREFGYTLVHGYLHLNGFDHIEDDEAEEMESLETEIMQGLGFADPYLSEK